MNRKLTVELNLANDRGSRRVHFWLDRDGMEFEEEENGVLTLHNGASNSWLLRYNPHAWQSYTLEALDD